jgi:hypothetical protein
MPAKLALLRAKADPSMSFSMTRQLIHLGPSSPVRTMTTEISFSPPPEMNCLEPMTT